MKTANLKIMLINKLKRLKDILVDLYSPKRIIKRLVNDVKENRIYYAIGFTLMAFVGITRIGMMDFDTGNLLQSDLFAFITRAADYHVPLGVLDVGEELYNTILPVGTALVVLYWLADFASVTVRDQLTPETIGMQFIKLVIGAILLSNGWEIMKSLHDFGEGMYTALNDSLGKVEKTEPSAANIALHIIDFFTMILPSIFMIILGVVASCVVELKLFTRSIKLAVLMGFAPIGLADLAGGTHSISMRYAKNVAAVALQGAVIIAINYAAGAVITSFYSHPGGAWEDTSILHFVKNGITDATGITAIIVCLTAIGMYSKSEDIARTIVGL